ncbi:hypothetical protein Tco_0897893 [Tanacetum coccineum]
MLTEPQSFYDNVHKQALVYQNLFYLKRAQRMRPNLYDGNVISKPHAVLSMIDDEETLILEDESRSKMSKKSNDPEAIKQNIKNKSIDYVKLNKLYDDFDKRFVPQMEMSVEKAYWLSKTEIEFETHVKIKVRKELPKVSLVNTSLRKLKRHLADFDKVVKVLTRPSALIEGAWGFEHTKAIFINEVIRFLTSLKDIFNAFDTNLINEVTEVQIVFNQMEAAVKQCYVDKKLFDIQLKESLLTHDRLLAQIMSLEIVNIVVCSCVVHESVNMRKCASEKCLKCLELKAEPFKQTNMIEKYVYDKLAKDYS